MRFRAEQHLRRQNDFRRVRDSGRRMSAGALTLWWLPPADAAASTRALPRLGVVASAHAVGGAVKRNRAKRRLREIFRRHPREFSAGGDWLLVARAPVNTLPFSTVEQNTLAAVRRMGGSAFHA